MKDKPKTLVVTHIPKTAGTTWRSVLFASVPDGSVYPVYEKSPAYLSKADFAELPEKVRRRCRVLIGHFDFGTHRILPRGQAFEYATFLRDPVKRCVSLYNHLMNHQFQGQNLSVADFIAKRHLQFDNHQTRIIAGKGGPFGSLGERALTQALAHLEKHYSFVGLTERFDPSYFVAASTYGWTPVPYQSKNLGSEKTSDKKASLTEADLELLRRHNQLDQALYDAAKARFEATFARLDAERPGGYAAFEAQLRAAPGTAASADVAASSGRLGKVSPSRLRGWARLACSEGPALVELRVNGKPVGRVKANLMRLDLREKGIHYSGRCGFDLKLPPEKAVPLDAEVSARVVETGLELTNSPQRFAAE